VYAIESHALYMTLKKGDVYRLPDAVIQLLPLRPWEA
jgi:hypothetical protein